MEAVDDFEISDIQTRVENKGNGLRTLIEESLVSEIFQSR
jgi:hypothetical protein